MFPSNRLRNKLFEVALIHLLCHATQIRGEELDVLPKEHHYSDNHTTNDSSIKPEIPISTAENVSKYDQPTPPLMKPVVHVPPYYEIQWPNRTDSSSIVQGRRESSKRPIGQQKVDEQSVRIAARPAKGPLSQNKQEKANLPTLTLKSNGQGQMRWQSNTNSNKPTSKLTQQSFKQRIPSSYEDYPPKPIQQQSWRPSSGVHQPPEPQFNDYSWSDQESHCENPICPIRQAYLPHPDDCCSFIICMNCVPHLMRCAPNTQYNPFFQTCTYPYESQCMAPNRDCHATAKDYGAGNIKM